MVHTHQTDVVLRFCDETDVLVVDFIHPLCDCCLVVVTGLVVTVVYELMGYRANNAIITTQVVKWLFNWLGFLSDITHAWLPE